MLLASPWSIRPGRRPIFKQCRRSALFIPSVSKVSFLQAVSSSIVWSLILFGCYYPSVSIYNAAVVLSIADLPRVQRNPILPKPGREDSYTFFVSSDRYVVWLLAKPRYSLLLPFARRERDILPDDRCRESRRATAWNLTFRRKISGRTNAL